MKKSGRNDPCPCKSGKKYKKCCNGKDVQIRDRRRERIIYGDEFVSDTLKGLADTFKSKFPKHEVIDVSRVVDQDTYKPLQLQHYKKRVIMLVERLPENEEVFATRAPIDSIKYMVMYKGAYQCFETDPYGRPDPIQHDQVIDMIKTRDCDQVWEEN